jgi:hypothetical protein
MEENKAGKSFMATNPAASVLVIIGNKHGRGSFW